MIEHDHLPSKLIIFICIVLTSFLSLRFQHKALSSGLWTHFSLSRPLSFQDPQTVTTISIPPSYVPCYFCHRPSSCGLPWARPSVGRAARPCPWSRTSAGLCCCLELCWAHGRAAAAQRGEAPGRHVTVSQLLWAGLFWKYECYICYHWGFS